MWPERSMRPIRLGRAGEPTWSRSVDPAGRPGQLTEGGPQMIILGVILLILGFVFSIPVLWTIGLILVAVGVVLLIVGATGRAIAGRRYWY